MPWAELANNEYLFQIHTVIIYIIMLMSLFVFYATSDRAGSPGRVWELLKEAAAMHPVEGNADGQYLTMSSREGGYIGLVFMGAGFAACVDSQLFQKAIACDPRSTSTGYIVGGLAWFTIPFVLASTYGIAAAAMEPLPHWPTYPNRMNEYEISSGLAMPYAAMALMGDGGAVAVLVMVFMAVTSAMSSETVATTALVTYNFYQAYFKPEASGKQLLYFSHFITVGFAIFCSTIAVAFNHGGFSVAFLITAIGIFVDSAIVPMACTIMWKKQSRIAVFVVPLAGSVAGISAWFLTAYTHYGVISIASLNENLPLVAGNMMALGGPILLTPLISYMKPDNFDWQIFKDEIKRGDDEHVTVNGRAVAASSPEAAAALAELERQEETNEKALLTARNRSLYLSLFLVISLVILWPIPMYATGHVFSSGFFTGWVVVLFLWAFFAAGVITLMPIWEGRGPIVQLWRRVVGGKSQFKAQPVGGAHGEEVLEHESSSVEKATAHSFTTT